MESSVRRLAERLPCAGWRWGPGTRSGPFAGLLLSRSAGLGGRSRRSLSVLALAHPLHKRVGASCELVGDGTHGLIVDSAFASQTGVEVSPCRAAGPIVGWVVLLFGILILAFIPLSPPSPRSPKGAGGRWEMTLDAALELPVRRERVKIHPSDDLRTAARELVLGAMRRCAWKGGDLRVVYVPHLKQGRGALVGSLALGFIYQPTLPGDVLRSCRMRATEAVGRVQPLGGSAGSPSRAR